MGIDTHGLHFLRHARLARPFGKTMTIGRQDLHMPDSVLAALVPGGARHWSERFCESLLIDCFGASEVDSIDHSAYEGARFVHDLNQPIPSALRGQYDTVFDGGSLEHIFNVPQALANCSALCRPGGQVLHVLPANNQCGHGFWQFSPELFFSLYSEKNGYAETEVLLADLADLRRCFRVRAPANGRRVNIVSESDLYVLVRTVLRDGEFSHDCVQQSDYVVEWNKEAGGVVEQRKPQTPHPLRLWARHSRLVQTYLAPAWYRRRMPSSWKLGRSHPDLDEHVWPAPP
jgi:SAM-dependent methyltransferase